MNLQPIYLQDPLLDPFVTQDAALYYNFRELPVSTLQYPLVQGLHSSHQGFDLPIQHGYSIQSVGSTPFDQENTPANFQRSTTESQPGNARSHNHNSHRSSDSRYILRVKSNRSKTHVQLFQLELSSITVQFPKLQTPWSLLQQGNASASQKDSTYYPRLVQMYPFRLHHVIQSKGQPKAAPTI
jgi:hypothetical protein